MFVGTTNLEPAFQKPHYRIVLRLGRPGTAWPAAVQSGRECNRCTHVATSCHSIGLQHQPTGMACTARDLSSPGDLTITPAHFPLGRILCVMNVLPAVHMQKGSASVHAVQRLAIDNVSPVTLSMDTERTHAYTLNLIC